MPLIADHHWPTSETPLNAFFWRADDGPTLNDGFFRGSRLVLLRNPFFAYFRVGGGSRPLPPSLDPRMFVSYGQLNRHV